MRGGFAFSIGVHALVLLLIILGLPFFKVKLPDQPPVVSVELVQEGKETTTTKVSAANRLEKQMKEDTPPPPSKPQTAPEPAPTPLEPAPTLEQVDASAPPDLQPPPELELKQAPPPAPQLAEIDESAPKLVAPKDTIKPRLAPAPALKPIDNQLAALVPPAKIDLKRPPPRQPAKSFDSVLKNLTKAESEDTEPDAPPQPARTPTHRATGAQAPLAESVTQSEIDAVRRQLDGCMNWPDGASNKANLTVQLDVTVNPDRTVASVRVVDDGVMAADPIYSASARAALRAVRMPRCATLDLPPEKYQEWQSITINLSPPT